MKLPFHLIVKYTQRKEEIVEEALLEFFGDTATPSPEQEDTAFPLFMEWLIYDYRRPGTVSFIEEYIVSNPHNLSPRIISQLTQITHTQIYASFIIRDLRRNKWIELEHLFSGEKFLVYDESSSGDLPKKGLLHARVGQIEGKWYFVGSYPIYFPISLSKRAKKIFRKSPGGPIITPKETWEMVYLAENVPPLPKISPKTLRQKRRLLKLEYQTLKKDYTNLPSFEELTAAVFKEDGRSPLDIFEKSFPDLPEEILLRCFQLFQDIWNYFPHRCLGNKSPVEKRQELQP